MEKGGKGKHRRVIIKPLNVRNGMSYADHLAANPEQGGAEAAEAAKGGKYTIRQCRNFWRRGNGI